jgi:hypothetical protein
MDDTRQWCWLESRDSETAHGPHATREAALDDARYGWDRDADSTIILSRCNWADPADAAEHVIGDESDLLEKLDEGTDDTLRNPEDETFELVVGAKVEDLRRVVAEWLKVNVKAAYFCCDQDAFEEVRLDAAKAAEGAK